MTRLIRLFALCLLLIAMCITAHAQPGPARPNIIFILIDDLRWDGLSITGHPYADTPNIDRLAREGAIFRNAFVTTPLCSPSRATFLTGQYVHKHQIVGNEKPQVFNPLSHQLKTWPQQLQKAGWQTAYIGKLHMGNDDTPRPGFDHWVSFKGQGRYDNPQFNVNGERIDRQGYMTDLLNEYALEYLRKKHDKPFAMIFGHKAVHGPFIPAERHNNLYPGATLPATPNKQDDWSGKPMLRLPEPARPNANQNRPANAQAQSSQPSQPQRPTHQAQTQQLAAVDEGVGQILKALADSGQLDRTLIIFTSDNGYFWGEHRLGDKRAAYEESIRIPFFVRYPKLIKAGTRIEQTITNADLAPTLLEFTGAPALEVMHGRSWLPLLKGKAKGWRETVLLEYFHETNFPRIRGWQAVRTPEWKYIHYTELEGMDELYDLRADRGEMQNLISDPKQTARLQTMQKELARLLRETQ
ncbi:MAG: sulfatase [Blastocatellia bacterium]